MPSYAPGSFETMYLESRKMLLLNLFAGSNDEADIENRLVDTVGKEREGWTEIVAWKHMHHHM